MNQMYPLNQQQNRYLESPYVIRSTCPNGQFLFKMVNNLEGGNIFKKDSFLVPFYNVEKINEREANNKDRI